MPDRPRLTPAGKPGKWSIQQVIEHLTLSYATSLRVLDDRVAKQRPTQGKPSLQQRIGQFVLIGISDAFPAGREAPAPVQPSSGATIPRSGTELAVDVHAHLARVDASVAAAAAMFGSKRSASHIILGPLSAAQWAKFHLVHGHHHIKQIQAIRNQPHA